MKHKRHTITIDDMDYDCDTMLASANGKRLEHIINPALDVSFYKVSQNGTAIFRGGKIEDAISIYNEI